MSKLKKFHQLFVLILLAGACSTMSPTRPMQGGLEVKFADLLANPARYDGKTVVVQGYPQIGFEERFFFANPTASDETECLTLYVENRYKRQLARLNGRRTVIKGVFSLDIAKGMVFLGMCNAAGIHVEEFGL